MVMCGWEAGVVSGRVCWRAGWAGGGGWSTRSSVSHVWAECDLGDGGLVECAHIPSEPRRLARVMILWAGGDGSGDGSGDWLWGWLWGLALLKHDQTSLSKAPSGRGSWLIGHPVAEPVLGGVFTGLRLSALQGFDGLVCMGVAGLVQLARLGSPSGLVPPPFTSQASLLRACITGRAALSHAGSLGLG